MKKGRRPPCGAIGAPDPGQSSAFLKPVYSRVGLVGLGRAGGFAHNDGSQQLDKLDKALALASTSIDDAGLFAEMLSLANDGRYPKLELSAQQRRQKTFEALIGQVAALSNVSPMLMIFEDAIGSILRALKRLVGQWIE